MGLNIKLKTPLYFGALSKIATLIGKKFNEEFLELVFSLFFSLEQILLDFCFSNSDTMHVSHKESEAHAEKFRCCAFCFFRERPKRRLPTMISTCHTWVAVKLKTGKSGLLLKKTRSCPLFSSRGPFWFWDALSRPRFSFSAEMLRRWNVEQGRLSLSPRTVFRLLRSAQHNRFKRDLLAYYVCMQLGKRGDLHYRASDGSRFANYATHSQGSRPAFQIIPLVAIIFFLQPTLRFRPAKARDDLVCGSCHRGFIITQRLVIFQHTPTNLVFTWLINFFEWIEYQYSIHQKSQMFLLLFLIILARKYSSEIFSGMREHILKWFHYKN